MPTVYLSPDPINSTQFIPGGAIPAVGGKLFQYLAGSSTKTDTYTDITGLVKWSNPIVLDSGGNLGGSNEVWIPAGVTVKFVLAPFNDTDPPIAPYKTWDNISGINDATSILTEWIPGPAPTFVSATSFTLVGDQTAIFTPGRRVKTTNTAGTRYGTISTSVFGAVTTVTITNDSGTLDSGLSAVWYALINPKNTSLPLIVNVFNFGVVGGGVTDDTAALNLAFASGNKLFRVPAGTYKLTSAVTVPFDVSFFGDGIGKTNFVQATANTSGFLTSASANRAYQFWGGFTITGAGIGTSTSIGVGFGASAATKADSYCAAFDIEVTAFGAGGFIATNQVESEFRNIHCHGNGTVGFKAVGSAVAGSNAFSKFDYIECYDNTTDFMLDIGNDNQLKRLYCWSNSGQTVLHNLWVRDSSLNYFDDCHIEPLSGATQSGAEVLLESTAGNINTNMVGNKITRMSWWRNGGTVDKLQVGTTGGGQAVYSTTLVDCDWQPVTGGTYHANLLNESSTNIIRPRHRSANFNQIVRELTVNNPNSATNNSYVGSYYEESYGTWTPVLYASVSAASLGTLTGTTKWQRRGNTVKVQFDVTLSAKNANTGNITLRGCEAISPNSGTTIFTSLPSGVAIPVALNVYDGTSVRQAMNAYFLTTNSFINFLIDATGAAATEAAFANSYQITGSFEFPVS